MAERLATNYHDASTAGVSLTVTDSGGGVVSAGSISALSYTLTTDQGVVIEALEDQTLTPANPALIVLPASAMTVSGSGAEVSLLLTVTWGYTDTLLGAAQATREYRLVVNNSTNK